MNGRCDTGFGDLCDEEVAVEVSRTRESGTQVRRHFCQGHGQAAIRQCESDAWSGFIVGYSVTIFRAYRVQLKGATE
jgi:hypothetical protein